MRSNTPLVTIGSLFLAKAAPASPPDGPSTSAAAAAAAPRYEVGRAQSFFLAKEPGSDAYTAQFVECRWLAAPQLPADPERLYPRLERYGIPLVYTNVYRTEASTPDGFLEAAWPLQAVEPYPAGLYPLDELHDVPRGLQPRDSSHTDRRVRRAELKYYGCPRAEQGPVPGAAGDPRVQQVMDARLRKRQKNRWQRKKAKRQHGGAGRGGRGGRGGCGGRGGRGGRGGGRSTAAEPEVEPEADAGARRRVGQAEGAEAAAPRAQRQTRRPARLYFSSSSEDDRSSSDDGSSSSEDVSNSSDDEESSIGEGSVITDDSGGERLVARPARQLPTPLLSAVVLPFFLCVRLPLTALSDVIAGEESSHKGAM